MAPPLVTLRLFLIQILHGNCPIAALRQLSGLGKLIVNPKRPGRCQLRVIRRRPKPYDLLNRPRHQKAAELAANEAVID